ncbi:MAG: Maf family protein [Spirochaetia bacterium]|nr:Maf family protein [Spirochaetia bacterium]
MNPDPVNSFNNRIILASASPARKSILEQAGFRVTVLPTFADEEIVHAFPGDSVEHLAKHKLSVLLKSKAITENIADPVITADTMVVYNDEIFGKPDSWQKAYSMLSALSGKAHSVYSGYAVYFPGEQITFSGWDRADITFFSLTKKEIEDYLLSGEWDRAAGAYRIQGMGMRLISSIKGSYFTVAGLPIHEIFGILRKRGFIFPQIN